MLIKYAFARNILSIWTIFHFQAFKFDGVCCDSTVSIPFNIVNLTSTRVKADFDLSKYHDFKLQFLEEDVDGKSQISKECGVLISRLGFYVNNVDYDIRRCSKS